MTRQIATTCDLVLQRLVERRAHLVSWGREDGVIYLQLHWWGRWIAPCITVALAGLACVHLLRARGRMSIEIFELVNSDASVGT